MFCKKITGIFLSTSYCFWSWCHRLGFFSGYIVHWICLAFIFMFHGFIQRKYNGCAIPMDCYGKREEKGIGILVDCFNWKLYSHNTHLCQEKEQTIRWSPTFGDPNAPISTNHEQNWRNALWSPPKRWNSSPAWWWQCIEDTKVTRKCRIQRMASSIGADSVEMKRKQFMIIKIIWLQMIRCKIDLPCECQSAMGWLPRAPEVMISNGSQTM